MSEPEIRLEPGALVEGRWAIEREIGRGGQSVVYRVRDVDLGAVFALKVWIDRETRDRLAREGRTLAAIDHPNVVRVIALTELGAERSGLVLEFLPESLASALSRGDVGTWEERDQVGAGVLAGVAALHAHGLVHRDLKPHNVLLARGPSGLVAKVADLGLVRAARDAGISGVSNAMGTTAYMAPEQLLGATTAGSDLWAAGAVLYEIATGVRAFTGATEFAVAERIRAGAFRPPRELRPDLPERMERAILASLQVDPARRVASAPELAAIWAGEVTEAPPVTRRLAAWQVGASALTIAGASLLLLAAWSRGQVAADPVPAHQTPGAEVRPSAATAAIADPPVVPALLTVTPPPSPAPRPVADAIVVVEAGAATVTLTTAAGVIAAPGELVPGRYGIEAVFADPPEVWRGSVEARSRRTATVRCDARFRRCVVAP